MVIKLPSGLPSGLFMIPDHPAFVERPEIAKLLAEEDRLRRAQAAAQRRGQERTAEHGRGVAEWEAAAREAVLAGEAPPPRPQEIGDPERGAINFPDEIAMLRDRAEQVVKAAAVVVLPKIQADLAAVVAEARPHGEALNEIATRANALQSVEHLCLVAVQGGGFAGKPDVTPARLVPGIARLRGGHDDQEVTAAM